MTLDECRHQSVPRAAVRSAAIVTYGLTPRLTQGALAPWTMRLRSWAASQRTAHSRAAGAAEHRRDATCRPNRSSASASRRVRRLRPTRARSACPASPTSRIPSPPPQILADLHLDRRHHRRGDPARRHRRHADAKEELAAALRRRRRRDRRRRHQARPDQVQEPRGSAGGELPQDAARDGARPARHPGQARGPHAQHAHDRGDGAARGAAPSRARRSTSTRRSPSASASTSIKLELEDLGFLALYPQRYRVIERALKRARGNQKEFLDKIAAAAHARRC